MMTSVVSAENWQAWRMADAMKIVECAAILDLFEEDPEFNPSPKGPEFDFPASANGLRAHVASFHGTSFVESVTRRATLKWQTMPADAPEVVQFAAFLGDCRKLGAKLGLPM